jgi:hypothetical protein
LLIKIKEEVKMTQDLKKMEVEKLDEAKAAGLIAKMGEKFPEEANRVLEYIYGLRNQNVAVLGEDEAFKLVDKSGEIRAYKSNVRLQATDGTLVQIGKNGPFVVSAQGYIKLEEAAGVIAMFAPKVLVDGQWVDNPHIQRDEKTKRILAIYCRAIAFRFTSKGIPQVSDRTTVFDVPAYRLIDLLAKAKYNPQAFKLLPVEMKPKEKEGEAWAHYSFDENTVLWVNTSHQEAIDFYGQIINREKKAMEFAQTFAKRNAVKHLLGVQKVPGQDGPDGKIIPKNWWDVPVTCWRPTSGGIMKWDASRYALAQKSIARIAEGDSSPIAVLEGTDYVSEEQEAHAEIEAGEIVEEPEDVTPKPKTLPDPLPEEAESKPKDDIKDYPPPTEKPKEQAKPPEPKDEIPPPTEEPPERSAKKKEESKTKAGKPPPAAEPGLGLKMEKQQELPVFVSLRELQKEFPEIYAQAQKEIGIQTPKTAAGAGALLQKVKELANKQK